MITIARKSTEFGEIIICRSRDSGSHIYYEGDFCQSEADGNGVSLASYVHAIYALLAQAEARDVLMIGCGGGTLGTMLSRAGRSVTIAEINPESIAFARQYFALPPEVPCHVGDGRRFLEKAAGPYDAIVVDAFAGGRIPEHFCSVDFFRLARQRMGASGCIFFNIVVEDDFDDSAEIVAARMAQAGMEVRLLDTPGGIQRNAIIMGGAVAALQAPTLLVAPETSLREVTEELEQMQFRTWRHSPLGVVDVAAP